MFFGEPFRGLIPGARGAVLSVLLRTGAPLTGRQVHALVSDEHSLWSVQEALKVLARLGIVETATIGRAGVHTINEGHATGAHLRVLADPIGMLRAAIAGAVGSTSSRYSSSSRSPTGRPAGPATSTWRSSPLPGGTGSDLEDAVRTSVGNGCDVLIFTESQFQQLARSGASRWSSTSCMTGSR